MKVQIIVGATRPERVTPRLAKWVEKEARNLPGAEVEVVDLIDYKMPFLDEAISPQYNPDRHPHPEVKKWLDKIDEADAFVLVTPEYNRSYSAVLKNALDFVAFQMAKKPVALVAHGSSGGAQAVAHLRGVLPGLKTFTTPSATYIVGRVNEIFDEDGNIADEVVANNPHGPSHAIKNTLEELRWYSEALAQARKQDA